MLSETCFSSGVPLVATSSGLDSALRHALVQGCLSFSAFFFFSLKNGVCGAARELDLCICVFIFCRTMYECFALLHFFVVCFLCVCVCFIFAQATAGHRFFSAPSMLRSWIEDEPLAHTGVNYIYVL